MERLVADEHFAWNRTLDPKTYEARELGDSWAVARESSPGSPSWVVARYDWSDPMVIRWTVEESSYGGHGTGWVRTTPTNDGGSRLHVDWNYTDISRTRDKLMLFLIQRFPMSRMIARMWVAQRAQSFGTGTSLTGVIVLVHRLKPGHMNLWLTLGARPPGTASEACGQTCSPFIRAAAFIC